MKWDLPVNSFVTHICGVSHKCLLQEDENGVRFEVLMAVKMTIAVFGM